MIGGAFVGLFISCTLGKITGNYPEKWVTTKIIKLIPASRAKKGKLFLARFNNQQKDNLNSFIVDFDYGNCRIYYFYRQNKKVKMESIYCDPDNVKFKKISSPKPNQSDRLIIKSITPEIKFWWISIGMIGNKYIFETSEL